jgi:hypothetical protein
MLKYIFEIILITILYRWMFGSKQTIVEHHHHYTPPKKRKTLNNNGDYIEYEEVEDNKKSNSTR